MLKRTLGKMIPETQKIRLTAKAGKVTATTTNLDAITSIVFADANNDFDVLVDASVENIVKKMKAPVMELKYGKVVIESDGRRFKMHTWPVDNFPECPVFENIEKATGISSALKAVDFARMREPMHSYSDVCLSKGDVVATNGIGLAVKYCDYGGRAVVPYYQFDDCNFVSETDDWFAFFADDKTSYLAVKKRDSKFPDYKVVLPKSFEHETQLNRDDWIMAIDYALTIANDTTYEIVMHDKVTCNEVEGQCTIDFDPGFDFPVCINGQLMKGALKSLESDLVDVKYNDKSIMISDETGYVYLMQIQK